MAQRPQKILVQSLGSRGDSQPYIAIGVCLLEDHHHHHHHHHDHDHDHQAGFDVTMATCVNHVDTMTNNGLKAVGVFCDTDWELKNNKVLAQAMADGDVMTMAKGLAKLYEREGEGHIDRYCALIEECKPDLVLSGMLCESFAIIAERHYGIPVIAAMPQCVPLNPPRGLMGMPSLPCQCCRRGFQKFIAKMLVHDGNTLYGNMTKKKFGWHIDELWTVQDTYDLKFAPKFGMLVGMNKTMADTIYGETVGVTFVGQFAVKTETQVARAKNAEGKASEFGNSEVMTQCTDFIKAGTKPIYVGFGSMTAKSPEHMIVVLTKAVMHGGVRAIMFEGWAGLSVELLEKSSKDAALIEYTKKNVLFVGHTPHAWLFDQCSIVIHHGGAGTTGTAARAGVPQIIAPCVADQWDHAWFLNQYGCGVGFDKVNLASAKPEAIGDAIKKILTTPSIKQKADAWAAQANAEPGVTGVVDFINDFWPKHVLSGEYKKYVDAQKKLAKR